MYMYNKKDFIKLLESILKEILKKEDFKTTVDKVCNSITEYYPNTQISLAEKLGRRLSYIGGSGKETYIPYEVIELNNNYSIVVQNFKEIPLENRDLLISLFKILLVLK